MYLSMSLSLYVFNCIFSAIMIMVYKSAGIRELA